MASETIIVLTGTEFTVQLNATPTTGYVWEVHTLPEDIKLLGSDYEKSGGVIAPGDQVIQVFRFRTLRSGEHTIKFVLKRPWESNILESHTVTVKAR
jgi:predicted secreted protein